MSVPALPAKMEPSALTGPMAMNAAVLKVSCLMKMCVWLCVPAVREFCGSLQGSKSKSSLLITSIHLPVVISGSDALLHVSVIMLLGILMKSPKSPSSALQTPMSQGHQGRQLLMLGVMLGHHPDICSSVTRNAYPHSDVWHNQSFSHSCACRNGCFSGIDLSNKLAWACMWMSWAKDTVCTACVSWLLESRDVEFVYCLKQPAVWYSPCSSSPLLSCPVSWDAGYCPATRGDKSRSVRPVKGSLTFSLTTAAQPCPAPHKAAALTACRHGNHGNRDSKL